MSSTYSDRGVKAMTDCTMGKTHAHKSALTDDLTDEEGNHIEPEETDAMFKDMSCTVV